MKTIALLILSLSILVSGCAAPSMDKLRAAHAKKYPLKPPPMPALIVRTNGVNIQQSRPFVAEKPEQATSFFLPAAVEDPPNGVMLPQYSQRVFDGTDWFFLAAARQGSNTILKCWYKTTVDGSLGFFPIFTAACWPEYQEWFVFANGNPPQGYVVGEHTACEYAPPEAFVPAGRLFVEMPTGKYITIEGVRYERIKVGGAGLQVFDPRFSVERLRKAK